jgi:UDP-glucose 4-epimerase
LEEVSLDSEQAMAAIKKFRPNSIFHFAAQIDVRVSASRPVYDAQQNIINTLRILEAGMECGMEYFVFASSGGAIYGEPIKGPQDEMHPEVPLSPYGVAKLSVDKYLFSLNHSRGLKSCSMRFSNVFGPRQGSRGEAGVGSILISRALDGLPLRVNGNGLQTRDFVYVKDLAHAGELIQNQKPQGILNLGTGVETSVRELAVMIKSRFPDGLMVEYCAAIPGEQQRSVLDASKARGILGWEPTTSLKEGIIETAQWFLMKKTQGLDTFSRN